MKCSICGEEIVAEASGWEGGHNARPVNDGRCCELCNWNAVIPARMAGMFSAVKGNKKDKEEDDD